MEAMVMAGHQHIKTTKRYETKKYDELQEQLKSIHPMERFDFTL
jgi:site-specific recombinase XerD